MDNFNEVNKNKKEKLILVLIITLTFSVTIIFWLAIKIFQFSGLPLYFSQLGLYTIFFLLAWWGMKKEKISLPVSKRLIFEALVWSLVGWLFFLLLIQLLGFVQIPEEFQALRKIPVWKIGAQILSAWFFVGLGEELLFRGYFLKAFFRHSTRETNRRLVLNAVLLSSVFFSLWHLPVRIFGILSRESDWVTLMISLVVLFLFGLGFAYLFIRTGNIILVGLVHGLMDYPLVGKETQLSFIILLVAIGCVEITRLVTKKKFETFQFE